MVNLSGTSGQVDLRGQNRGADRNDYGPEPIEPPSVPGFVVQSKLGDAFRSPRRIQRRGAS